MRKGMILMMITGIGREKENEETIENNNDNVFWPGIYKNQKQSQEQYKREELYIERPIQAPISPSKNESQSEENTGWVSCTPDTID